MRTCRWRRHTIIWGAPRMRRRNGRRQHRSPKLPDSDGASPIPERYRKDVITIVSGLPRSGTSLMMQMLAAGGMTLLTDSQRKPDTDNPRGYCEWEPIKQLPKRPNLIDEADGKVVKVI